MSYNIVGFYIINIYWEENKKFTKFGQLKDVSDKKVAKVFQQ